MSEQITREQFVVMTGREPLRDDLDRVNCQLAGQVGHYFCGLCRECQKPRFVCGHYIVDGKDKGTGTGARL